MIFKQGECRCGVCRKSRRTFKGLAALGSDRLTPTAYAMTLAGQIGRPLPWLITARARLVPAQSNHDSDHLGMLSCLRRSRGHVSFRGSLSSEEVALSDLEAGFDAKCLMAAAQSGKCA